MRIFKMKFIFIISLVCLLGFIAVEVKAEMAMYDDDGQFLGLFVDEGKVYNPAHESYVSFSLSTGDITSGDLYFESDDCSGLPYIRANPKSIIKHDESYYKTDDAQLTERALGSVIIHQYHTCYAFQIIVKYRALPAEEIDPPYNLPVYLPLQVKIGQTGSGKWNK